MLENFTKDIMENIIDNLNNSETKEILKNKILEPVIQEFQDKLKPYLSLMVLIYGLNLLLIILILILLLINRK
jgi:hypothetical protein